MTHIEPQSKAWGSVRHVFDHASAAVSVLHVERGGFSSRHYHRERINRFIVVAGAIEVVTYSSGSAALKELSRSRLAAGDVFDVHPNIVHRFEVIESGIVVEVYWTAASLSFEDIVRLDTGGAALP
jgi:quercetin dioxygenase-like cupin family protein